MQARFILTAPIVPKKNSKTPRRTKFGRLFLQPNQRAVTSEQLIHFEAIAKLAERKWRAPTPARIGLVLFFPHHPRADAIGLAETVLDALQGVAYLNDRQVKELEITMLEKGNPGPFEDGESCLVEIKTIGE